MNEISQVKEVRIENEEMRDERGMRQEGKSDGCDCQASIARDAWLEVDYSGPCGLQSTRAVGMTNCSTPHPSQTRYTQVSTHTH